MQKLLQEKYIRPIGIVLVGTIIAMVHADADAGLAFGPKKIAVSIFFAFTFWQGDVIIMKFFRRKFPEIGQTVKRIFLTIVVAVAYTGIADFTLHAGFSAVNLIPECTVEQIIDKSGINLLATFIIGTLYESTYFFAQWKKTIVEAEEYKNQQLRSQFETLKNQISPHFLFNSLNTLITLIGENQKHAVDFTQRLSEVYRYILQNKDQELVQLKTELEFVRSFVFLLKMRFGENLQVNIDVGDDSLEDYVAPLTLQMLIENAIKHNEVSNAKPLVVDLYLKEGEYIVVKNNLQKKNAGYSSGIGLENIRKRYEYLSNTNIEVITTALNFMVTLPLIKLLKESH